MKHILSPGRYVGVASSEEQDENFEEKMAELTKKLQSQFNESLKLQEDIQLSLRGLGYEI